MTRERLCLYDTTLRDGAQTHGVDFSLEDKALIAQQLDVLGIDYIEAGYPGANPIDTKLFAAPQKLRFAALTAFGMTKRPGRSISNDPGFQAMLAAKATAICLVGKTWDFHVDVALGITPEENLQGIKESVAAVVESGREALLDCEHFFDGYKANPDYALACAKAAYEDGARWIVLCDTNGGTLPEEIEAIVAEVVKHIPGDHVGIHVHNDTDNGVANSLAAVRAGARQIQGTLNGLGERCGNANLTSIIPTLMLKPDYAERFETGVTQEKLRTLTHASRILDELLNRAPDRRAPYVGESAFAHKGGIHVSAVQKDPRTYEHVPPEAVGNQRRLLVSDQGGRSNILAELDRIGIAVPKDDPRVTRLLDAVKEREAKGYAYEAAEASFELLVHRARGNPAPFTLIDYIALVEQREGRQLVCEATIKVQVGDTVVHTAAEGNGPVNALDAALRKALTPSYPEIGATQLFDYKVRVLDGRDGARRTALTPSHPVFGPPLLFDYTGRVHAGRDGTAAGVRVLVESGDHHRRWSTVGCSTNIIEASWSALADAFEYAILATRDRSGLPSEHLEVV